MMLQFTRMIAALKQVDAFPRIISFSEQLQIYVAHLEEYDPETLAEQDRAFLASANDIILLFQGLFPSEAKGGESIEE